MEKVPMTQPGFAALELELKRRQSEDRHRIVTAIAEAREGMVHPRRVFNLN